MEARFLVMVLLMVNLNSSGMRAKNKLRLMFGRATAILVQA